jgi:hypothetical protein
MYLSKGAGSGVRIITFAVSGGWAYLYMFRLRWTS